MPLTLEQVKALKPGDKLKLINDSNWNLEGNIPKDSIFVVRVKPQPENFSEFREVTIWADPLNTEKYKNFGHYAYRFELVEEKPETLKELYDRGIEPPYTCFDPRNNSRYEVISYDSIVSVFDIYDLNGKYLRHWSGEIIKVVLLPGEE